MATQTSVRPDAPAPRHAPVPSSRRALLVRAGIGIAVVIGTAFGGALLMHASIDPVQDQGAGIEVRNEALAGLASWGMQLRGLDVAEVAGSAVDLVVIDELAAGARTQALARDVERLKAKPDGSRRLVLAHLSIGGQRTDTGERRARFWEEAWQARIVGAPSAAMERILAAGFDGVYLDHGDVHVRWGRDRASARDDMTAFVERISQHAREWRPGFIVTLQNPGALIESARLRASLDAVAKVDLLYGSRTAEAPNPAGDVAADVALLKRARRDGLPVLVIEHLSVPDKVAAARRILDDHGFISYIGPRDLDRLVPQD